MQLLLERKQGKSWTGLPIFKLWVKFDLTSEENELIEKYRVWRHILTEGNFRRDFLRALRWTIPITLVISFFITREPGVTPATLLLSLALFFIILYVIYQQLRELIYVDDVLKGRTFKCRSVVKLAAKE